jgi:hypothetical protein
MKMTFLLPGYGGNARNTKAPMVMPALITMARVKGGG